MDAADLQGLFDTFDGGEPVWTAIEMLQGDSTGGAPSGLLSDAISIVAHRDTQVMDPVRIE